MRKSRRLLLKILLLAPRTLVWRFAKTYIAGESLDDAVRTVRQLNAEGCRATIDVLGEEIERLDEVRGFVDAYRETLQRIVDEGLDANVSVKPTALGLKLSPEAAYGAFVQILGTARSLGLTVRIDMEDSSTTQTTLDLYRRLRDEGFDNVGIVIQSYLRRTLADARDLAAEGASVRLCKGIYVEPREVAYQEYQLVRESFVEALAVLLESERARVGIATHDDFLVFEARRLLRRLGTPKDRYEFQMLLGVDPQLRRLIVSEGHPLRVYVPFGAGWYGYSVRRLLENPKLAGHVVRNVLGFGTGQQG
jgi:proline dehydrogenase